MRIVRCTNYFRTQKMADSGITGIQCTYLLCINRTSGISQEQLASQLYKDKSVIARHLASLESNGYIHREPDPKDRRVQKLYLTAKAYLLDFIRSGYCYRNYRYAVNEMGERQ